MTAAAPTARAAPGAASHRFRAAPRIGGARIATGGAAPRYGGRGQPIGPHHAIMTPARMARQALRSYLLRRLRPLSA
ncbi:MAG: hypothetical protein CVT71_02005 [Alphaproteobacteria bacterium HGW-Alphaproteobacteria-10]|nr:MAG: hypothetical protein CVT71_02005 [Alphaproteobacteria bacterium HGW-Alphaproteobacteria-10]